MARWIALLRGVNISGRNKVAMRKVGLGALGYANIVTLQNSGNAVFDAEGATVALSGAIAGLMRERFGLEIPVYVTKQETLRSLLTQAPPWWG